MVLGTLVVPSTQTPSASTTCPGNPCPPTTPVCSGGNCVQCAADSDCKNGMGCDPAAHTCTLSGGAGQICKICNQIAIGGALGSVVRLQTIDAHCGGDSLRLVVGGFPAPQGKTMAEKRAWAARHADRLRRVLLFEPRGHADMYGGFVTEPEDDGAQLGVVFFHNAGYSTACGHGTIALVTWAIEAAIVPAGGSTVEVVVDVRSIPRSRKAATPRSGPTIAFVRRWNITNAPERTSSGGIVSPFDPGKSTERGRTRP